MLRFVPIYEEFAWPVLDAARRALLACKAPISICSNPLMIGGDGTPDKEAMDRMVAERAGRYYF